MSAKDKIKSLLGRVYRWIVEADWRGMGRKVINFIGNVMHMILFDVLLPKRYRGVKKQRIYEVIFKSDTPAGKRFDVWLLVLILLNIVLLVVDSLTGTTTTMTQGAHLSVSYLIFKLLEWAFTLIFTFEYYLRIYCLKRPWKYVFSFWGIIDFLSIFPAYLSLFVPATQALTVLRLLRVMRIFRIFKMKRFQEESYHLLVAMRNSAIKILIFMLFVLVASVILGTMMFSFESNQNESFDSILTGIYWAVVTITTVGYGDVVPVTVGGRFLAVLVMLLGYSVIAVPTGIVAGETIKEYKRPKLLQNQEPEPDEEEEEAVKN